jgi:hypothetical protein
MINLKLLIISLIGMLVSPFVIDSPEFVFGKAVFGYFYRAKRECF